MNHSKVSTVAIPPDPHGGETFTGQLVIIWVKIEPNLYYMFYALHVKESPLWYPCQT
jgi:hypothetical protein